METATSRTAGMMRFFIEPPPYTRIGAVTPNAHIVGCKTGRRRLIFPAKSPLRWRVAHAIPPLDCAGDISALNLGLGRQTRRQLPLSKSWMHLSNLFLLF